MQPKSIPILSKSSTTASSADSRPPHKTYIDSLLAEKLLRKVISKELKRFNLSMQQWLFICEVGHGDEVGALLGTIAQRLGVSAPQVSLLGSKLQQLKLIRIRAQREDHRGRRVTLTSRGRVMLKNANGAVSKSLEQVFASTSPQSTVYLFQVNSDLAELYRRMLK